MFQNAQRFIPQAVLDNYKMTTQQYIEGRKNWRFRWLGLLFEFSHIDYQRRLWFDKIYSNEIGWFSEDICQYFDDLYLDDNYVTHLEDGTITQKEFDIIKEFHLVLDRFVEMTNKLGDSFDESKILENPDWIMICNKGTSVWKNLKKVITDTEEIKHMNGLEKEYL